MNLRSIFPTRLFLKNSESTSCRVVFDGSSHGLNEYSLNDCLDVCGNLNPDIFPLLLKFRKHRYGITADCSKAFLRILLKPEEHKYCRYLWINQEDLDKENPRVVQYAMQVVLFGLRPSTYILASVIHKHLESWRETYPEVVDLMINSFYVDDLCFSISDKDFAMKFVKISREIMREGGMELCKFKSNLGEVKKNVITDIEEKQDNLWAKGSEVFGITWDQNTDKFKFSVDVVLAQGIFAKNFTKRSLLKAISRIYDPHGILGCFTIGLK